MCGVMTAKKGFNNSCIAKLSTLWYVGFQLFFLVSYNFLEFDKFIFSFQHTYNNRLKERYEDNPLTYQILIQIYGWRQDRPVGLIETGCMDFLILQSRTCWRPFDYWMLAIDFEHSNSRVQGDVRPTSIGSNNPFSMKNMNESLQIMKNFAEW
jgi:hypothetical protein